MPALVTRSQGSHLAPEHLPPGLQHMSGLAHILNSILLSYLQIQEAFLKKGRLRLPFKKAWLTPRSPRLVGTVQM